MQNFYLPDFYFLSSYKINKYFIDLIQQQSNKIKENINIKAIYGCFPGQIWNGGRTLIGEYVSEQEIIDTVSLYKSLNIPMRFTYTNTLLENKHLKEPYCNLITEIAHNGKNEILVNSPILEAYLREKYPNYKYLSSTTKCLLNKEDIISEGNKYYLTVLDYRFNKNIDFLKQIPNPEKYEILINPYCGIKCSQRKSHYELLSKQQLENNYNDDPIMFGEGCNYYTGFIPALLYNNALIKVEELQKYEQMGFNNFKIEGRYYCMIDVIESYVYYMIKPEYQNEIRCECLKLIYT